VTGEPLRRFHLQETLLKIGGNFAHRHAAASREYDLRIEIMRRDKVDLSMFLDGSDIEYDKVTIR
jgi:hypothetical protein